MEAQQKELSRTVESQQRELASFKTQLEKVTQQRDELDVQNAAQKRELRESEDRIRRLIEDQAGLKGEIQATKEALNRAQAKADELAGEKKELAEKVRESTVQLTVADLKMEKLKSDVALLEEKVKSQAKEVQEKEQLLKSATADMLEMQKKLAVVECESRDLGRQVARYKVTAEEQERNMQRLMNERMELSLQLNVKEQTHQKLDESRFDDIRNLQEERAELLQQLADAKAAADAHADEMAALKAQVSALKTEVDERLVELRAEREARQTTEAALHASKDAHQAYGEALKVLQAKEANEAEELATLKVAHSDALAARDKAQEEVTRLTAALTDTQRTADELTAANAANQAAVAALEGLKTELAQARAAAEALEAAKAAVAAELAAVQAELVTVRHELQVAKAADGEKEARIVSLEALNAELVASEAQHVAKYAALQEQHAMLDNKYIQLKGHFQKAMEKIEDLRAQRDHKQDQVEALEQSSSRLSAEFNARMTKHVFESEEWRKLLTDIQERVTAYTAAADQPAEGASTSLLNLFSSTRTPRPRRHPTGADLNRSASRIDTVTNDSLSNISGGPPAELLEELAALKVRNKVLEDTLNKMQTVITSTAMK